MKFDNLPKGIYLVDMDGVLFDFFAEFNLRWANQYPERRVFAPHERTSMELKELYPNEYHQDIDDVIEQETFFASMSPIKYAIEGIKSLYEQGNDVRICTSPNIKNDYCIIGKINSIKMHLGPEWLRRTIITKDKTVVNADYLIDDKPHITGSQDPNWEHILYDHPYNQNINKKRFTWSRGLF